MTAIQQFWIVGIPTILTSNQYPVAQKDDQTLSAGLVLSAGIIKPTAFTDENDLQPSVALTAGARLSTAVFNIQPDTDQVLTGSVVLSAGIRNSVAAFNIQPDVDQTLQSDVALTAGVRTVVAVFNTQPDEQTLTASVVLTAGVRT